MKLLEQLANQKRTRNLGPFLQIVQKVPENYVPCLYSSADQVWWINELWFKRYIQKCTVSCANTHHDITDLVYNGKVKTTKTWISWEWNIIFLQSKTTLNLCFRWNILRSYHFVAEVTFKCSDYSLLISMRADDNEQHLN